MSSLQKLGAVFGVVLLLVSGYYFYQSYAGTTVGLVSVEQGFVCGTSTVNDADGNVYNTVQIGQQCWMKQNMRVGTMISGAFNQENNGIIEKYCYNNDPSNCTSNNPNQPDGAFYEWDEAMQYSTTPGAQGICPSGWHIPTHDEFTTLERAIATSSTKYVDFPYDTTTTDYRGTYEGAVLKPNGSSGFEANLAGAHLAGFSGRGSYAYLWSSSRDNMLNWLRLLDSTNSQVYRNRNVDTFALSIRCLKDAPTTSIGGTLESNTSLKNGLVGHWTFDGPDFTDKVYDKSGQGNHGYVIGVATSSAKTKGKFGQGLHTEGISGYVDPGTGTSLNFATSAPFSVTGWFKTSESFGPIISLRNSSSESPVIDIAVGYAGSLTSAGKMTSLVRQDSDAGSYAEIQGASLVNDNTWHHFVLTRQGSTTELWLDGVSLGQYASQSAEGAITTNQRAFGFERAWQQASHGTADQRSLTGELDDIRVYNRILSAEEIQRLYTQGGGAVMNSYCGSPTVQDADGNTYDVIRIGDQCWMKQNMRVGTRINGATNQTNNGIIEKWCYSDTASNCTDNHPNYPDGGLYQWDEAMQYSTTSGARGICPTGFHIPTDLEWYHLERTLADKGQTCDATRGSLNGCANAGTKLQPNGTSGFESNLAGRYFAGFANKGAEPYFWSSTEFSSGSTWYRSIFSISPNSVYRSAFVKSAGFSVRCIKDSN